MRNHYDTSPIRGALADEAAVRDAGGAASDPEGAPSARAGAPTLASSGSIDVPTMLRGDEADPARAGARTLASSGPAEIARARAFLKFLEIRRLRQEHAVAREKLDAAQEKRDTWLPRKSARPRCGARCRSGHPCRAPVCVRPGRRELATRCRLHGGLSTGPRTPEGRARSAAAAREGLQRAREARLAPRLTRAPAPAPASSASMANDPDRKK
jgi:hypothetical protein